MKLSNVRWGAAIGGMLLVEVLMIAAAFGWVAIYSHLIQPDQAMSFYQDYAMKSSAWVSLVTGVPLFYFVCRWIGSKSPVKAWPTAMALFASYFLIDVLLVLTFPANPHISVGFLIVNWAIKGVACHMGGTHAARKSTMVA
jgi:hypothetical protein